MAFLDNIISGINTQVREKLTAFPTGYYAGLVYQIARSKDKRLEYLPAETLEGNTRWLTFDDLNELIIYHRIINSGYSQIKNQSYGDGYDSFQHNYDIDLIVMANRKKVYVGPDVLEAAISSNIPLMIKVNDVEYVNITPVSANHNSRSVFGQEFVGVQYFLRPEHILFSIRYRIELRYQKGCISLCQCN